jgi:hypothetical protein
MQRVDIKLMEPFFCGYRNRLTSIVFQLPDLSRVEMDPKLEGKAVTGVFPLTERKDMTHDHGVSMHTMEIMTA